MKTLTRLAVWAVAFAVVFPVVFVALVKRGLKSRR